MRRARKRFNSAKHWPQWNTHSGWALNNPGADFSTLSPPTDKQAGGNKKAMLFSSPKPLKPNLSIIKYKYDAPDLLSAMRAAWVNEKIPNSLDESSSGGMERWEPDQRLSESVRRIYESVRAWETVQQALSMFCMEKAPEELTLVPTSTEDCWEWPQALTAVTFPHPKKKPCELDIHN